MKDENEEMNKDRGVPTDPNLLNAPAVLKADALTRPTSSSIETSNGSSATEGGRGLGPCGDCPACKGVAYIDANGEVITEVVDLGEGVFLGPDDSYFDPDTHEVVMDFKAGIGVIAIDKNVSSAVDWWVEQQEIAAYRAMVRGIFGDG